MLKFAGLKEGWEVVLTGLDKGVSEEADDVENHFIVSDVVNVVGVGIASVYIEHRKSLVVFLDAPIKPSDEVVRNLDISFFIGNILISVLADASLLRQTLGECKDSGILPGTVLGPAGIQ